jgi:pimeloyl-ACP methyl ester carboxylesterase
MATYLPVGSGVVRPRLLWLLTAAALVGGCSGEGSGTVPLDRPVPTTIASTTTTEPTTTVAPTSSTTTTTAAVAPPTVDWKGCGENLECGTLAVPLDYDDASKGTIALNVERRPARKQSERIGSLLVDPGGPGVAGTLLAEQASFFFSDGLRDRFDIVAWDPRGTGRSSPLDCTDDLDPLLIGFDPTPTNAMAVAAKAQVSAAFVAGCEARSGAILPYVGTQDSARDMDRLRRALGEPRITYLGFSYGSELGATWATMFPNTVRAAVFDGALDANAGWEGKEAQQLAGLELGFNRAMQSCAADPLCPFSNGGDPITAYEGLAASLDAAPLVVHPERPPLNEALLSFAVASTLRTSDQWDDLYEALADAQHGNGKPLYDLYDAYVERSADGTFSGTYEAFVAISCVDNNGPKDAEQFATIDARLRQAAPHLFFGSGYNYTCGKWPVRSAPLLRLTAAGAGPIVVVGTTGDAITPLESSRSLADALEQGVLLTVEGDRHTGYGLNTCSGETVDAYLIDLRVPAEGMVCQ